MKKKLLSVVSVALLIGSALLSTPANAQTNTDTNTPVAPSGNPVTSLINSTVIDTNSAFWESYDSLVRCTAQLTSDRQETVVGFTKYFGKTGGFGVGPEIVFGGLNTVDAGYVTAEWGLVYYNVRPYVIGGAGYDLAARSLACEIGGGLDIALTRTGNVAATTQFLYQKTLRNDDNPLNTLSTRAGVCYKF